MARLAHTAIKHIPKSASKDTRAPNLADGGLQLQTYQEDVHTPGARWTRYHALEQKTRSASDSHGSKGYIQRQVPACGNFRLYVCRGCAKSTVNVVVRAYSWLVALSVMGSWIRHHIIPAAYKLADCEDNKQLPCLLRSTTGHVPCAVEELLEL